MAVQTEYSTTIHTWVETNFLGSVLCTIELIKHRLRTNDLAGIFRQTSAPNTQYLSGVIVQQMSWFSDNRHASYASRKSGRQV